MHFSKLALVLGGSLKIAAAADVRSLFSAGNSHRQNLVAVTCAAELTACNLDATCATCWTTLFGAFPALPKAVTCDALDSWFTSATPLPATCYDYTAVTPEGQANNPLSVLAFCYYGDVSTTSGLACTSICAEQQKACEADVDCAGCLSGKTAVAPPDATYTCPDYLAWYQATEASYPATCDITGQLIRDVTFCKYDVTLAIAGVFNCPAEVQGTIAPSLAPVGTIAPSSAPTFAPTFAPTIAPTMATMTPGVIHIEAEDFMAGDGVGYFISVPSTDNQMNEIRTDEIVTIATLYDDTGAQSGYSVRRVTSGDWFRYTIDVATAGTYAPTYHIAAFDANNTGTLSVDIQIVLDGGLSADPCAKKSKGVGELNRTPVNTGDWRIFEDFSGDVFDLPAGAGQVITVCLVDVENFEFDYFTLTM